MLPSVRPVVWGFHCQKGVRRFLIAPNVAIDPEYATGEPTIKGSRLRIDTIIEALSAGEYPEDIAEMWHITPRPLNPSGAAAAEVSA